MKVFYTMDTTMPIPNNFSCISDFKEIKVEDILNLDISYSIPIINWAKNEFQKIFKTINIQDEFNFNNIFITFYKSYDFNVPNACFDATRSLIAIKVDHYNTGNESEIQKATIHELTHATTSNHVLVGLAITEGIASYIENLFCISNSIPYDDDILEKDEGYIFGYKLIKIILSNVYNNNLKLFFNRIKRGNEKIFINDIDNFLKKQNIPYNAEELLRLSSILFYAKELPDSPFQEYKVNYEMESLRNELLNCFNKHNNKNNLIIYRYLDSLKYINYFNQITINKLNNYITFITTLDRELGNEIAKNGSNTLLNKQKINKIIKKTFNIIEINKSDSNIKLKKNFVSNK